MNGFSVNKKHHSFFKVLIGAVIFLVFLAVLNFFISPVKNFFYAVSSPMQKSFWTAGTSCSGFLGSLASAGSLASQNQNLQTENQKLLSQVALLQSISNGNQAQSDISASCQNSGFKFLMAGVMGLDNNDILSINKGSADGIALGMPVVNQQSVLFGKVYKVYKNYSQIMLISNKNSVINVKIQSPSGRSPEGGQLTIPPEIDGVVKGLGNSGIYLDLVPIDSVINQGDVLVTSALDANFPKDLLVGKITKVEKNDQNPHQQAQIQPFLNVSTDDLFVITNYKQ